MTFKIQFPNYVRQATGIANLHMQYQFGDATPTWAFGPHPTPLSIQAPEPTLYKPKNARPYKTVEVTFRYARGWKVRIGLMRTIDSTIDMPRDWKLVSLTSFVPEPEERVERMSMSEGADLYRLVSAYGIDMYDVEYTIISRRPEIMTGPGIQIVTVIFPNGDRVEIEDVYEMNRNILVVRDFRPDHM